MTVPAPMPENPAPPKWIAPWLALLAPLYIISPLSLLALPYLKKLPKPALYILGFYALSQQIPALFTPEPLLASLLALVRTLLMFGLIGVGVALGDSQRLKPFAVGLVLVFITALIYSSFNGLDIFIGRLSHPYMTPITVGLAGAFGIWFALFGKRSWWRVPLGVLSLAILLLSGSRGPLLAALVGIAAALLISQKRRVTLLTVLGLAALLIFALYAGDHFGLAAISRLNSADNTGRDVVWSNTLSVIRAYPLGGVGSYLLGGYLSPPGPHCTLFPDAQGAAQACPAWIQKLGSPWLIAHNATLQQLAETGPLGLLGLLTLLGAACWGSIRQRSGLNWAILTGLLVATITDNTLLVPSPFFAELFWVVVGMQLLHLREMSWPAGLMTAGIGLVLSAPVLANSFNKPATTNSAINLLNAPMEVSSPNNYTVYVQFDLPAGDYRASLNTCDRYCTQVQSLPFKVTPQNNPLLTLQGDLWTVAKQRAELRLLPAKSSLNLHPLGVKTWTVHLAEK